MFDLKARRIELGLTMLDVARAVGVSEATISRYESGNIKNMRRDRIEKYAQILQVSPALFIGLEEEIITPQTVDPDIRRIERARKNMPPEEKERMMNTILAAFGKYFSDDFVDEDTDE